MADALLADISSWQPASIDWNAYASWSKQGDGVARVIMRASQGTNLKDANFEGYWSGATSAGIEVIGVYHYCYPQYNAPDAEAAWFHQCVGSRLRPSDFIMIDFEENNAAANASWLLSFAQEIENLFGRKPYVYSYLSLIQNRLQDSALSTYPLVLADWTYNPDFRPACPAPFTDMEFVQYSDKVNVPGMGTVDADVFVGKGVIMSGVPSGWNDDGTKLTAPNGHYFTLGFRDHVLNSDWSAEDFPLEEEHDVNQLQLADPSMGGGVEQVTRKHALMYSQTVNGGQPLEMYIGVELLATRQALDTANTEISSLNSQIAALNQEIAQLKSNPAPIPANVVKALQDADSVLAPFSSVKAELDDAMKTVGG